MIELVQQELQVSGKIDYRNAETYYQQGLALIQAQSQFPMVVNLAQLEHGSTLALAVLIPYFAILSLFNKKLKNKFQFQIEREETN